MFFFLTMETSWKRREILESSHLKTKKGNRAEPPGLPGAWFDAVSVSLELGLKYKAASSRFSLDTVWYRLNQAVRHGSKNHAFILYIF